MMTEKLNAPKAKKSLMNALENLEMKANKLRDLANFSDTVIYKLRNPRPMPEPSEGLEACETKANNQAPDLIDLFNSVADSIEISTERIGINTEKIKSIIE